MIALQLRCETAAGRITLDVPRLEVRAGERLGLIGANGAGKSTLLRCLSGFARPVSGTVRVGVHAVVPAPSPAGLQAARCEIAQILQGVHLVQRLTVRENVLIGALGRTPGWRSWVRWPAASEVTQANAALAAVGLAGRGGERCDRLSGGERQKAAIARMLMQRPGLILADEPTASLDPAAAREACALLCEAAGRATLITVVHDPALLPLLADRVIGLRHGRIAFDRPVQGLDRALLDSLYASESPHSASAPTSAAFTIFSTRRTA